MWGGWKRQCVVRSAGCVEKQDPGGTTWVRKDPTHSPSLPLLGHRSLIRSLILDRDFDARYPQKWECVGHWWPSWTSNPVVLAKTRYGGFDSHALPPSVDKRAPIRRFLSVGAITADFFRICAVERTPAVTCCNPQLKHPL